MTRILVADDQAQNRYYLEALLHGHGFDVVTAEMGRMLIAMRSRGCDPRSPRHWPVLARSLGALFIRSRAKNRLLAASRLVVFCLIIAAAANPYFVQTALAE